MIPQRNLSLIANRLQRNGGGRRIPEDVLERDYCIAWFLSGLSASPLRERLVFKGGTALRRCYFEDYRFSEDLDFTLAAETDLDLILSEGEKIFLRVREESGVVFKWSEIDREAHKNSHTIYLGYEGPMPARAKRIKVDITVRERIVSAPVQLAVLRTYEEFADIPAGRLVPTYSLVEIAAEKVVALTDRARNEPRDLYDLWYLIVGGHIELDATNRGVLEKLAFRDRVANRLGEELAEKEARLKALWGTRLSAQMSTLPEFEEVYRAVARAIRQSGISG